MSCANNAFLSQSSLGIFAIYRTYDIFFRERRTLLFRGNEASLAAESLRSFSSGIYPRVIGFRGLGQNRDTASKQYSSGREERSPEKVTQSVSHIRSPSRKWINFSR